MPRRSTRIAAGRNVCRLMTFSLSNVLGKDAGFDDLMIAFDSPVAGEAETLDQCRKLVGRARNLKRLPPVVPVTSATGGEPEHHFTDDLATILAVLARSSDKVFMRRHVPVMTRARLERTVTLVLPADWSP